MTPTLCSLVVSNAAALLSLDLDAVALRVVRQVGAVDVEDVGQDARARAIVDSGALLGQLHP